MDTAAEASEGREERAIGNWKRRSLLGPGRNVRNMVVSSEVQRRKYKRQLGSDGQGPG